MKFYPARSIAVIAGAALSFSVLAAGPYEGEIRKVDKPAAKLTIKHGPLTKLDMPPMTMVFQVREKAFLDRVKVGDKVAFDVEKRGGAYVVTQIEAAQ